MTEKTPKKSNGMLAREFKPKSRNQAEYIRKIVENDITYCVGPAGSGKTACAVGLAMSYFAENKVKRIIITRPTIDTDEDSEDRGLGFLPGDIRAKMDPYLRPIFDEMLTYLGKAELERYIYEEIIEISPLNFMRGRTFHDAFVILDEAQNASYNQLKMINTRLGSRSKMVINGDIAQHDRRGNVSPLDIVLFDVGFAKNPKFGFYELDKSDIVRHELVREAIEMFEAYEEKKKAEKLL